MREHAKKIVKITIGTVFITIGVGGLFLPLLPGIILIIAGVFLIDEKLAHSISAALRIKERWQKVKKKMKKR